MDGLGEDKVGWKWMRVNALWHEMGRDGIRMDSMSNYQIAGFLQSIFTTYWNVYNT